MSATVTERRRAPLTAGGDPMAAHRAVVRWAWRLFGREWRQQFLVLALIVVAVAATIVGSAVATNTPRPANFGFGTAQDAATYSGTDPHLGAQVASLQHRFGAVEVIANQTLTVPGSTTTYQLRAQNPNGPYAKPMLSLVSGHYPTNAGQVALTQGVANELGVEVGGVAHTGGRTRSVVGIVENPQSLLDNFALVPAGQVSHPTQVTALFDAHGVPPSSIGPNVATPASVAQSNVLNPETISLAVLTIGMLLIALVAVGGFTVLVQRRLRSLGMLASLGATTKQVGLVVRANGVIVGVIGSVIGTGAGLGLWEAYRPALEASAHHTIGVWALPWVVVALAIVLAIVATFAAAARPARTVTKIPIVAALSGRPAPPRKIRRSALPGLVFLGVAFLLLGYSGSTAGGGGNAGMPELVLGLVALIPAVILLSPFCLSVLARLGRRTPVAVRLALRDLARYRARSGSALAAISIGVLIAVIIVILAAARYGNTLDYAGPNLAANQLVVNSPPPAGSITRHVGPKGAPGPPTSSQQSAPPASAATQAATVHSIASELQGARVTPLESPGATVLHRGGGRNFSGQLYVATPRLLDAFGISPTQINPKADILTMRPGFASLSGLYLLYNIGDSPGKGPAAALGFGPRATLNTSACNAAHSCLPHPVVQELSALPPGTSAPNTVLTEHAVRSLGLHPTVGNWLVQTPQALSAVQIKSAQQSAAQVGMTVESKNDQPTSAAVINWATLFGIALALCILAMSVGLIRSETAGDLRTLTATGASSFTRRNLTSATAGALALAGAVLGTFAGYVAVIGWLRDNTLNGGISAIANVPVTNLAVILLAMPAAATVLGWLLAGRQPSAVAHQPIE